MVHVMSAESSITQTNTPDSSGGIDLPARASPSQPPAPRKRLTRHTGTRPPSSQSPPLSPRAPAAQESKQDRLRRRWTSVRETQL